VISAGIPFGRAALSQDAADRTTSPAAGTTARPLSAPELLPTTAVTTTVRPAPPAGVVADPDSLLVLVDHDRLLPIGWEPLDLTAPAIPFIFDGPHPKRLMRREAASAIEQLSSAARDDGVVLVGVSAYRSAATQRVIYEGAVARNGEANAARTNARPGHSEHQTGLAIDVTGADRSCVVSACFAQTAEARWLEGNAHWFGFVIRYPAGKEHITGYRHEPWHLRYVGVDVAVQLTQRGLTLDEHLGAR
jgi:D-alanyl-D-alanine carboxypeptidase